MPKIQWTNRPPPLRQHLFDLLEDRKISVEDLYQLKLWRESEPEAPEGLWYKDFGSFKMRRRQVSQNIPSQRPSSERQISVVLVVLRGLCGETGLGLS